MRLRLNALTIAMVYRKCIARRLGFIASFALLTGSAFAGEPKSHPPVKDILEQIVQDVQRSESVSSEVLYAITLTQYVSEQELVKQVADRTEERKREAAEASKRAHERSTARQRQILGKPFDLKAAAIDGSTFDGSKWRGKVVLIDFWATWCGPCVHEVRHMIDVYNKYHDKGLEIVGVSSDSSADVVTKFVTSKGMAWPECVDKQGIADNYDVDGLPTVLAVNKKGLVVANTADWITDAKTEEESHRIFDAEIEKLLSE